MTDLAEIMQKTIKSIAADQAIVNAARRMRDERIGSLLVEENDDYVGILTETDIVRKAAAEGKDLSTLSVKKLMTQPLVSIESTKTIRDANEMMGTWGIRHLVVCEAGKVVGMVSIRDILRYFKSFSEPVYSEPNITQD
ncbi:MAG: CBS domain-containing protein [Nitrospirota bacterium]|nr:CBS domain-containing protein [Nitrospirota bacterium]